MNPISIIPCGLRVSLLALAWLHVTYEVSAAHGPNDNVGPGESRLNQLHFKASHNSYERLYNNLSGIPLDAQVDDFNVWSIELDLHRKEDGSFWVEHFCASAHNAQSLSTELAELNQSVTAEHKITMVYIQLAGSMNTTCYKAWPTNETIWLPSLKSTIKANLGGDSAIYSADEWINQDQSTWPSWQELSRRGYKWFVVIADGGIENIDVWNDDLVFAMSTNTDPLTNFPNPYSNLAVMNLNAGSDSGGRSDNIPADGGDRYLFRGWPTSGVIGGSCTEHNGEYWIKAITRFNYTATNCIDDDNTTDPGIHSPQPLYVNLNASNSRNYGTHAYPRKHLMNGINAASPLVDVMIRTGTYDIDDGTTISRPVFLKAENGSVIIK